MTRQLDEQTERLRHDDPSRRIHHRARSIVPKRRLLAARVATIGLVLLAGAARADDVVPRVSTKDSSHIEGTGGAAAPLVGAPSESTGLITGQLYQGASSRGATQPGAPGEILTPAGGSPVPFGLGLDTSEMPFQPSATPGAGDAALLRGEAIPRTASGRKAPPLPAAGSPRPSDLAFDLSLALPGDGTPSGPIDTAGPHGTDSNLAPKGDSPTLLPAALKSPGALILVAGLTVAAVLLAGWIIYGRHGRFGHRKGHPPATGNRHGTAPPAGSPI